jgi:hypothetical protein
MTLTPRTPGANAYGSPYYFVVCLALLVSSSLVADDALPEKSSTDDALLESLDAELLEGLETVPDKSAGATDGADSSTAEDDEFTRIAKRMRDAAKLIPTTGESEQTKSVQKEIVSELDQLIQSLEKQCQQGSGQSSGGKPQGNQQSQRSQVKPAGSQQGGDGAKSSQPARDSTERLLPDKAREQMLQTSPEQFLPKYELMIEQYFKRLAEEQSPSPR